MRPLLVTMLLLAIPLAAANHEDGRTPETAYPLPAQRGYQIGLMSPTRHQVDHWSIVVPEGRTLFVFTCGMLYLNLPTLEYTLLGPAGETVVQASDEQCEYLQAPNRDGGRWVVRVEDTGNPRLQTAYDFYYSAD
jgi:hypothetical protein